MCTERTPSGPTEPERATITDESALEAILETDTLVLIEFHADWCAACSLVTPALRQLQSEYLFTLARVDVDTDAGDSIADRYDVSGLPTIVVVEDGEHVDMRRGIQQKGTLRTLLQRNLD
jgi:thioredoxin 1